MRLDTQRVRSLHRNTLESKTVPSSSSRLTTTSASSNKKHENKDVGVVMLKSNPNGEESLNIETANANTGTASSSIGAHSHYSTLLQGFIDVNGMDDRQGNQRGFNTGLYEIYRDIYNFDPVGGSAVDLMSNMPFSDFSLSGAKDTKYLIPYEESIDNTHVRTIFPTLSAEYLVHGLFCSTTLFEEDKGVYRGMVPQNIDYIETLPMPVWGQDPLITLKIGDALKTLTSRLKDDDDRLQSYIAMLPPEYRNGSKVDEKATHTPNPEDVIYIPRGGLVRSTRGVSIFNRVLPIWLMEKAMYRGTLDQAVKRQRPVSHMQVGDGEWEPTTTEMTQLAQMLLDTDKDPVGAIFVTRNGVNVSDIRDSQSMWKWSDLTDFFTTAKLRAMGISESFITGDATYNSLEQVMSVFVEQMRSYRERVTSEIFYERMFPRIAQSKNFKNKTHGLAIELAHADQLNLFPASTKFAPEIFLELASEQTYFGKISYRNRDLLIPQLHWHKRLRPEADDAYLAMLGTLAEKGVPIPVRLWAAAGGLDLQTLVNQMNEDMKIRDTLTDWVKAIAKFQSSTMPPEPAMGGMGGGEGEGGDEFASLITKTSGIPRQSILGREYGDEYEVQNRGSDGKRHLLTAQGKKVLDERMNKQIASVATEISRKINAMETKMEDRFNEMNKKITRHFMDM